MVLPAGDVFKEEVQKDRLLHKFAGVHVGLILGQVGGQVGVQVGGKVGGHIAEEVVGDIKNSITSLQLHKSRY